MQINSFSKPGEYVAHGAFIRNRKGEYYKGFFSVWFNIDGTIHDAEWFPNGHSCASRSVTAIQREMISYDMASTIRRADIMASA